MIVHEQAINGRTQFSWEIRQRHSRATVLRPTQFAVTVNRNGVQASLFDEFVGGGVFTVNELRTEFNGCAIDKIIAGMDTSADAVTCFG